MSNINKKELSDIFNKLKENRNEGFNELYSKYNKVIYGVAFSILKNKENSEDVVQTVFTKIFQMKKENLPSSNEASWLYTLTKNESINFILKHKNHISVETLEELPAEDKDFEDIINKDTYNKIIKRLGEKEREIVSLKIISGMTFKDISKLLKMPIGTVQWKYYTSIHTLKILIGNISLALIGAILFTANRLYQKNMLMPNADLGSSVIEQGTLGTNDETQNTSNSESNITDSVLDSEVINSEITSGTSNQEPGTDSIENENNSNISNSITNGQEEQIFNETQENIIKEENYETIENINIGIIAVICICTIILIAVGIKIVKSKIRKNNKKD